MKNMKNQLKRPGLVKFSIPNQAPENQASSSIRSQTPNENSNPESFDSPYKNSLSEIKQIILNDDGADDFRTPKPIKKVAKRVPKVGVIKKSSIKRTKKKVTSSIEKYTKNNFQNLDVNPDHLQMALALSKSTFAEENPEEYEKSKDEDFPVFLSPEKIPKVGTILERYGFRLNKNPKLEPELCVSNSKESKNSKHSKFRFVTPTLLSRNNEERESLITAKISLIISQGIQPISEWRNDSQGILTSNILQKYHCHENHIFSINIMAVEELKTFCYYCNSLKVPPSQSAYGCLLKKWDEIPGREKSPERSSTVINNSDSRDLKDNVIEKKQRNCPSPDLFDSDNESFFLKTSETIDKLSSSSLNMSPPNSSASLSSYVQNEGGFSRNLSIFCRGENGIEYFESFNTDSENVSEEVFHLTRSEETGFQETPEDEPIHLISSSSNDSCSLEKIEIQNDAEECEENIDEVDQTQQTYRSTLKKSPSELKNMQFIEQKVELDDDLFNLTQNSPPRNQSDFGYESNQLSINIESKNQKKMLDADDTILCSLVEDKLTNQHEIMDHTSLSNDNLVQDKYFVSSFEKSKILLDDSMKRLSSGSDRHSNEYNSSKSLNVTDYITQMLNSQPDQGLNENNSDHSTQNSCSQETIVLSDEELNYSSIHSREQKCDDFYNLSDIDEIISYRNRDQIDEDEIESVHSDLRSKYGSQSSSQQSPEKVQFSQHSETKETEGVEYATPKKIEKTTEPVFHKETTRTEDTNNTNDVSTPDNNILIKTTDVTPMVNYDQMDTPSIRRELDKFGFKPLKRPRAIKLLKYVYETTHPVVSSRSRSSPDQEDNRAVKRRRTFELGDEFLGVEDLIFERKISSKVVSCRIPLQIAWYNFVSENPQLQENILLYEPIQLEVVHSMLKEQSGCKFHIEDMITFLDKKCITFRTTQSQGPRTKKII